MRACTCATLNQIHQYRCAVAAHQVIADLELVLFLAILDLEHAYIYVQGCKLVAY